MTAYSSQPDSTANNDGSYRDDTGANNAGQQNSTTITMGLATFERRPFFKFDLHEDGAIQVGASLGTWNLTLVFTAGTSAGDQAAAIHMMSADGSTISETSAKADIGALSATTVVFNVPDAGGTVVIDISTLIAEKVAAGHQYPVFLPIFSSDNAGGFAAAIGAADNATAGNRPLLEGSFTNPVAAATGAPLFFLLD